jgi:hypothetical protein
MKKGYRTQRSCGATGDGWYAGIAAQHPIPVPSNINPPSPPPPPPLVTETAAAISVLARSNNPKTLVARSTAP